MLKQQRQEKPTPTQTPTPKMDINTKIYPFDEECICDDTETSSVSNDPKEKWEEWNEHAEPKVQSLPPLPPPPPSSPNKNSKKVCFKKGSPQPELMNYDDLNTIFKIYQNEYSLVETRMKYMEKQHLLMKQKNLFVSFILLNISKCKTDCSVPVYRGITEKDCVDMFQHIEDRCKLWGFFDYKKGSKSIYHIFWSSSTSMFNYLKHTQYKHVCERI